jgi:16S rRNA (cytosine1402-N4)-methyltransferase
MAETRAPVGGILLDLGVSSMQLDRSERGFSYRQDGPLDMRMSSEGPTAASIVNEASEEELADIIYELGEERRSRRVAAAIVRARSRHPIETTDELSRIVSGALGSRRGGAHPARRTFQALRLAVNEELEELQRALPIAVRALAPGGRLVVIAYHSLEDRIVKRFFVETPQLQVITRKPIRPTTGEVEENPARGALACAPPNAGETSPHERSGEEAPTVAASQAVVEAASESARFAEAAHDVSEAGDAEAGTTAASSVSWW